MSSGPEISSPAPCANAGIRADSKWKSEHNRAPAIDCEADAAGVWLARVVPHAIGADASAGRFGEPAEALRVSGPIDFSEINRAALAAFPAVLTRILPGGKLVGSELRRAKSASLG